MNDIKLSKRLSTAASYVRSGAFVADIGTDHAYLPIYLVLSGKAVGALASDINKGPIITAKEHIEKYGLSDKIRTQIANGLENIEEYERNASMAPSPRVFFMTLPVLNHLPI